MVEIIYSDIIICKLENSRMLKDKCFHSPKQFFFFILQSAHSFYFYKLKSRSCSQNVLKQIDSVDNIRWYPGDFTLIQNRASLL